MPADPTTELERLVAEMEEASVGCWCAHEPGSNAPSDHEAGCPYVARLALSALREAVSFEGNLPASVRDEFVAAILAKLRGE